jgi:predicted DNA-binding protein
MNTITIDIPPETYRRLEEQSRRAGKAPETFTRELLELALQANEEIQPQTARAVLQAAGRVRLLSDNLRRKIIPGVTLDEVRTILSQAAGPTLSEIIQEQRGAK